MPLRRQAPITHINSGKLKGREEGAKGGDKPLNPPYKMLLLPATPIPVNKLHNPRHKETDQCAYSTCITKPLTTIGCSGS